MVSCKLGLGLGVDHCVHSSPLASPWPFGLFSLEWRRVLSKTEGGNGGKGFLYKMQQEKVGAGEEVWLSCDL